MISKISLTVNYLNNQFKANTKKIMKNKNQTSFLKDIISSPLFFIAIIVVIFGAIIYYVDDGTEKDLLISGYNYNPDVVTITEYGDYQCPACGKMYEVVEDILKEYEGKITLDYRHFPLSFHENAMKASVASECAREQGKFWEMHGQLYTNQTKLQIEDLKLYASQLQLDSDSFTTCLDENRYTDKINEEKAKGELDKINGTPTFYVNGQKLTNSENDKYLPVIEDFEKAIEAE